MSGSKTTAAHVSASDGTSRTSRTVWLEQPSSSQYQSLRGIDTLTASRSAAHHQHAHSLNSGQGTSESADRSQIQIHVQQQPEQQAEQPQVDASRFYVSPPPPPATSQSQPSPHPQRPRSWANEYSYAPRINRRLVVLFDRARRLSQRAVDRTRQSFDDARRFSIFSRASGPRSSVFSRASQPGGRSVDRQSSEFSFGDDTVGGGDQTRHGGQSHRGSAFFFHVSGILSADNARSYLSDMCSLLLVLLQAPFVWLKFVCTGRDYHDRYGHVSSSDATAAAAEGAYGGVDTAAASSKMMSAEELQERSEVYLEARDEDGTLFAMLAFHHPGLCPLIDETVENVEIVQHLGDTAKTGQTDLSAALDPDRMMMLNDSEDEEDGDTGASGVTESDGRSAGSGDGAGGGPDEASSPKRGRRSRRSKSRTRSTSLDAHEWSRDSFSSDEWEYE